MDTLPMPLDALAAQPGGLDEFRVTAPREVGAMLKQLQDGSVRLNLNGSDGHVVAATLWSADSAHDSISFSVEALDPNLAALLECEEVVVVGYMESVKVQFDVRAMVLVHGARASVLRCAYPRELFRFQRRGAYRVRPLPRSSPMARLRHTDIAEMQLALRVVDVSIGGCALFLPDDVPAMQLGGVMNRVEITLDDDTWFHVDLRLQHVTSLNAESRGVRLGCEFVNPDPGALRGLQRYIDQTQKRTRLMGMS